MFDGDANAAVDKSAKEIDAKAHQLLNRDGNVIS